MGSLPLFSILIPTKHRPEFVEQVLRSIYRQDRRFNSEVIVSDNYDDPRKKCNLEGLDFAGDVNVCSPPGYLRMVDNWNFLISKARGKYIILLTDKMLLLPGILADLERVVNREAVDIITWVDDKWYPKSFGSYFGVGFYVNAAADSPGYFDPREELQLKASGTHPRRLQTASQYARGKICFGAFSRKLVDGICKKYGQIFHDISPDYTSMILGLANARMAYEVERPGIMHVNTDISNGGLCDCMPGHALEFFREIENGDHLISSMPIPGVYSSTHNSLASDFVRMKHNYKLGYGVDLKNWYIEIGFDLFRDDMIWRSTAEKEDQQTKFLNHIQAELGDEHHHVLEQVRRRLPKQPSPVMKQVRKVARRVRSQLPGSGYSALGDRFENIENAWRGQEQLYRAC